MRDCFETFCKNGKEAEWVEDDSDAGGHFVETENDCFTCNGTGKVEDGCYCFARTPYECCCDCDWGDLSLWDDE